MNAPRTPVYTNFIRRSLLGIANENFEEPIPPRPGSYKTLYDMVNFIDNEPYSYTTELHYDLQASQMRVVLANFLNVRLQEIRLGRMRSIIIILATRGHKQSIQGVRGGISVPYIRDLLNIEELNGVPKLLVVDESLLNIVKSLYWPPNMLVSKNPEPWRDLQILEFMEEKQYSRTIHMGAFNSYVDYVQAENSVEVLSDDSSIEDENEETDAGYLTDDIHIIDLSNDD
mgnify:CR=1 FL=1